MLRTSCCVRPAWIWERRSARAEGGSAWAAKVRATPRPSRIFEVVFMVRLLRLLVGGASITRPADAIPVSPGKPCVADETISTLLNRPIAAHLEIGERCGPADHQQSGESLDPRDKAHVAHRIDIAEAEGCVG